MCAYGVIKSIYIDMKYNTIKIQKGNDCELWLKPRMLDACGKPGKVIPAEELTDVQVKFTVKGEEIFPEWRIQDGFVCAKINDGLPCGEYDVCLTAKWAGRDIRDNRQELLAIVEYGDGINYALYKQDFVVIGSTPAEIDELRARMLNKIEEAENAKEQAETAKDDYLRKAAELDGVAQEATCQATKALAEEAAKSAELAPLALEETSQIIKEAVLKVEQGMSDLNPEGEEKPKIYSLVETLVAELAATKEVVLGIQTKVMAIEQKVDALAAKGEAIETKVEDVAAKVFTASGKVFTIDGKVDTMQGDINLLKAKADGTNDSLGIAQDKLDGIVATQAEQDQKLFDINNTVNEIDGHLHPNT